jgi:16S rRNA (guanine1207-N2)-methyltransferase
MPQYFEERPETAAAPGRVELRVGGRALTLETDSGVFSRHRLDPGTAVLLRKAPPPPEHGVLLDLGCGYGPIACALAAQRPDAHVWAVDVNERARALTARNATENGLTNITVVAPDDVPADETFDAIFSNPPVRIGKDAMHELLATWLDRMDPAGRAFLVVQRHLGADSLQQWLQHEGFLTERLASSKGYRVLVVAGRITDLRDLRPRRRDEPEPDGRSGTEPDGRSGTEPV